MEGKEIDIFSKNATEAYESSEVPKLYANGFSSALGMGDVTILLQQGPKTVAVLNLSYTVAKTLSIKLGGLIKSLEDGTGNTIMTTDQVETLLSDTSSKGKHGKPSKN